MMTGLVSTLAGSGGGSSQDGEASRAQFSGPLDVAVTPDASKVVVADSDNRKIRLIDMSTRMVGTLAGSGKVGLQDGSASSATFAYGGPDGVAVTPDGGKVLPPRPPIWWPTLRTTISASLKCQQVL